MIWMHRIVWRCAAATFKWVLVTKAEFARTVHLTGAMIKLKAAKLAIVGCVGITAGALPPAVYYGPGIVRGLIAGPSVSAFDPARYQVHAVPEPSALGLLIVGIGGLCWARRR